MKKGDHFQELPETLLLTTTEGICPLIVKIVQGINNHGALLAKTVHPFFLGTDLARVISAIIASWLDFSNTHYLEQPSKVSGKLHLVQNAAFQLQDITHLCSASCISCQFTSRCWLLAVKLQMV